MTIGTAKLVKTVSKVFLYLAVLGLVTFFVAYFKGKIEFKYISLPIMACIVGVTWFGMSKLAIVMMEREEEEKESITEEARKK